MTKPLLLTIATASLLIAQPAPAWKEFSIGPPTRNASRISRQGITAEGIPLQRAIARAYGVPEFLVLGPGWIGDDRYALTALVDDPKDFQPLFQQELEKHFHLAAHREMKQLPVFLLQPIEGSANKLASAGGSRGGDMTTGNFRLPNSTLAQFCTQLADFVSRPVIDETGIAGRFDISLSWSRGDAALMAAVQDQLGLQLTSAQRSVEVLVVDHVEKVEFPAPEKAAISAPAATPVQADTSSGNGDLAGDWRGTMQAAGHTSRLVLHFAKGTGGGWLGSVDNLDQIGGMGLPYSSVSFDGSTLKLIAARNGTIGRYEGKLDAAGTIRGTWSQTGLSVPVVLTRDAVAPAPPQPPDFARAWQADLDLGMAALFLVVHIDPGPNGVTAAGVKASMDSPDQDTYGMRASSVRIDGAFLTIEWKDIGAAYKGRMSNDRTSIEGLYTQGSVETSMTLKPAAQSDLERKRPQTPVKPYPYREEKVRYSNPAARIQLAATLTIPEGPGPFPAALLIAGSGPLDRDETAAGHKIFLVLADYLTRHGVAVLRADKRGVGESKGDFARALTIDFASDAEAGVTYLRTRKEVDAGRIGLVGHSEGGIIAPMLAARQSPNSPGLAFIVLMAGPGMPGDQFAAQQAKTMLEALGGVAPAMGSLQPGPWLRALLAIDPTEYLRKVTCPVLAINGSKDKIVLAEPNLAGIRTALEAGGNQRFVVEELPGLNHFFQTADTGWPKEYGHIEQTIAPSVLDKISNWIRALP